MERLNRLHRSFVLSLIALLLFICCAISVQAAPPQVWAVSEMERVGLTDSPRQNRNIELYAAKAEYAPFQVVVRAPAGGLTNMNLKISNLIGPKFTILGSRQTLYREHYLEIAQSSPDRSNSSVHPGPAGWYADALIPFIDPATGQPPVNPRFKAAPIGITSGENQPYWVDLFVPRNARPGKYVGYYTITSDQGSVTGRITLNVWNFALPLKPSQQSLFLFWTDTSLGAVKELMRHKLMPLTYPPSQSQYLMSSFGLNVAHAGFWSGADVSNHTMWPAPSVAEVQARASQYPGTLELVNYSADEITGVTELYEPLKEWARNLHAGGVKQLVTMAPTPELFDDDGGTGQPAVDIWSILPLNYYQSPTNVAAALSQGMDVWTYTTLNQDDYSPKWLADFAPINFRALQGFINQSMGFNGILYWAVDHWNSADPWTDISSYIGQYNFAGDGQLMYPGADAGVSGVLPSMRMKWIREGIEDYEYVQILKDRGRGELASSLSRSVAADFISWSQDPALYESVRRQLAKAICKRPSEPVTPPAVNLITNPGFESQGNSWNTWGTVSFVSSDAHSGSGAVSISPDSGVYQDIPCSTTSSYTLSGWGRYSGADANPYGWVGVTFIDAAGSWIDVVYRAGYFSGTDYSSGSVTFTPPANAAKIRVLAQKDGGSTQVYVDDLSLYKN